MKEFNAENLEMSKYAKALVVAYNKDGKTVGLTAGALGVLPWQEAGGIVDRPENLHIVALDSGAATGVPSFLKLCGAPKEAYKVRIYNLADDVRTVGASESEWDFNFYNLLSQVIGTIRERAARGGTHAVIISSLTTLALTLERAIAGPPGNSSKRGMGMDQSKWSEFARQVAEIRNHYQEDKWHCLWEGHVYKPKESGQNAGAPKPETLQVSGKTGDNFPNNVEQVFRFRRQRGETYEKTKVDQIYLDTRPAMDFIPGGRLFTEMLDAKEDDMTIAFYKLGLKIGRWNSKTKKGKS